MRIRMFAIAILANFMSLGATASNAAPFDVRTFQPWSTVGRGKVPFKLYELNDDISCTYIFLPNNDINTEDLSFCFTRLNFIA